MDIKDRFNHSYVIPGKFWPVHLAKIFVIFKRCFSRHEDSKIFVCKISTLLKPRPAMIHYSAMINSATMNFGDHSFIFKINIS